MPVRWLFPFRRLAALVAVLGVLSCQRGEAGRTGRFESKAIPDRRDRVELVSRYVKPVTPIEDAGFFIDYRDNSGGMVPGPSDWTILAALRVGSAQAAVWTAFYQRELAPSADEGADLRWGLDLVRERGWAEPRGRPVVFTGPRGVRAVFQEDGIILIRDATR